MHFRSIPFLVTLTALCLSITVTTSCRFLVLEGVESNPQALGLFRWGENLEGEVCSTFRHRIAVINEANSNLPAERPRTEGLSNAHKAAQFGGIFACILGFTAAMLLFLSFFFQRLLSRCVWRITLPILLISAAVIQSITFFSFGDKRCQTDCGSNTEPCQVVTCTFDEGANRALAALVLYLFMGISIIFYPKRTSPLVKFVTDDKSQHAATKSNAQLRGVSRSHRRKIDDIEMAEQEQLDETENEPDPEANDWIHSGNDSDQLAAPMSSATSSTKHGFWPSFGDNVAQTGDTALAVNRNNVQGSVTEGKVPVAPRTHEPTRHSMSPPATYSTTATTAPTKVSQGLSSEEYATEFSISPKVEGKLLHDDSGAARQRRHKRKSSSRRHIENQSERRGEGHTERNSERNSEKISERSGERPRRRKDES